jgi:hypothetical protein
MAWTTPPTFVTSNAASAAQLNILSDDLEFLQGIGDAPNAPFQSVVFTTSGRPRTTCAMKVRVSALQATRYPVEPGDDVKIKVNGYEQYQTAHRVRDGMQGMWIITVGSHAGTWYPVTFEWKDAISVCTCTVTWYLSGKCHFVDVRRLSHGETMGTRRHGNSCNLNAYSTELTHGAACHR